MATRSSRGKNSAAARRRASKVAPAGSAARRVPARPAARRKTARPAARRARPRATPAAERRRQAPETLRLRGFMPSFTTNDLQRSLAFYTDVLGFIVIERWSDGDELRGVMLRAGTCDLALGQDDWAKGRDRKKGVGMRLWCQTEQDIDALAGRIRAAGGVLTEGPVDQPWGARLVSVDDPDGFHISIYKEIPKTKQ